MKIPKLPLLSWVLCLAGCLASVIILGATLPDRVAGHFDVLGHANGWTARSTHTALFIFLSVGFSSVVIGLVYAVRFFPSNLLNVPHADYWRSPERFPDVCDYLFGQSFWFGALSALWVAGLHYLIVRGNRLSPPVLDSMAVSVLTMGYAAATLTLIILILRHFNKLPGRSPGDEPSSVAGRR